MENILTAQQMKLADLFTIEKLNVSQNQLVLRAGNALVEEIVKMFDNANVLVCVGKGNNGADGVVAGDILSKKYGFTISYFYVESPDYSLFNEKFDIILDCLFGTGLNRELTGEFVKTIEKINTSNAFIVSCDIPSGLSSDNGLCMGACVKANLTIAIQEYKFGHFLNDGLDFCGKVIKKDIGIKCLDEYTKKFNDVDVKKFFLDRKRNVNKGNFGKVALIGGSKSYTGSIILSSNSLVAIKTGVGYVNTIVPNSLFSAYVGKVPECLLSAILDDGDKAIFDKNLLDKLLNYDCIAIGMGMGVSRGVYDNIEYLLNNYRGKLLIDADGLNCLAKFGVNVLKNKKCKVVLTPHVGEFSRLISIDKNDLIKNLINYSIDFAKNFDLTLIVKSATSVITDGKQVYLNTTGTSALAKAGSGDVLSGIIAGMLVRDYDVTDLTAVGAYVLGKASEIATKKQNVYTVTASDVIDCIACAINDL